MLKRMVIALPLLFTLFILVIRAQGQPNTFLDILFTSPSDCRLPCFLGVSLGQTSWQNIIEALQTNEAVSDTELQLRNGCPYVTWNWTSAPSEAKTYGLLLYNGIPELIVPSSLTLGEVRLALAEPSRITMALNHTDPPRATYVLEYAERNMYVKAGFSPCEMSRDAFWQMQADSDTNGSFFVGVGMPDYVRSAPNSHMELDPHSWAKQIQDLCRQ